MIPQEKPNGFQWFKLKHYWSIQSSSYIHHMRLVWVNVITQIRSKHSEGKLTLLKSLISFLHTFMPFYPQGFSAYTVLIHTLAP